MGFCYPGRAASGDCPPHRECAPHWHAKIDAELPNIGLTVLVGTYLLAHYLPDRKPTLTDIVRAWREYLLSGWLPHPSPRNQP